MHRTSSTIDCTKASEEPKMVTAAVAFVAKGWRRSAPVYMLRARDSMPTGNNYHASSQPDPLAGPPLQRPDRTLVGDR